MADQTTLLLKQYAGFWASLSSISRMPAADRQAALTSFTIDPELKSILAGLAKLDANGQVLYGQNRPRATATLSPNQLTAVVNDCQDSSRAGTAKRSTMAPINVGVSRNHIVTTMRKVGGIWKLAFVSYTKTPC